MLSADTPGRMRKGVRKGNRTQKGGTAVYERKNLLCEAEAESFTAVVLRNGSIERQRRGHNFSNEEREESDWFKKKS